jgi:hypothetical protein
LHAATDEEAVGSNEEGIGVLARNGVKGRFDLAACAGVEYLDLQPDSASSLLHVSQCGLGVRSIHRIGEHGDSNGSSSCRSPSRLPTTSWEKN